MNSHHVTLCGKRNPLAVVLSVGKNAVFVLVQLLCKAFDVGQNFLVVVHFKGDLFPDVGVQLVKDITRPPRVAALVDKVIEEHALEKAGDEVTLLRHVPEAQERRFVEGDERRRVDPHQSKA